MGKRGRIGKGWTIKYINGEVYFCIWVYDAEESKKKKEKMREEMTQGFNEKGITPRDIHTKSSVYRLISLGPWYRPKPKLKEYLRDKPQEFVDEVNAWIKENYLTNS